MSRVTAIMLVKWITICISSDEYVRRRASPTISASSSSETEIAQRSSKLFTTWCSELVRVSRLVSSRACRKEWMLIKTSSFCQTKHFTSLFVSFSLISLGTELIWPLHSFSAADSQSAKLWWLWMFMTSSNKWGKGWKSTRSWPGWKQEHPIPVTRLWSSTQSLTIVSSRQRIWSSRLTPTWLTGRLRWLNRCHSKTCLKSRIRSCNSPPTLRWRQASKRSALRRARWALPASRARSIVSQLTTTPRDEGTRRSYRRAKPQLLMASSSLLRRVKTALRRKLILHSSSQSSRLSRNRRRWKHFRWFHAALARCHPNMNRWDKSFRRSLTNLRPLVWTSPKSSRHFRDRKSRIWRWTRPRLTRQARWTVSENRRLPTVCMEDSWRSTALRSRQLPKRAMSCEIKLIIL